MLARASRELGRPGRVAVRVNPDFELKGSGMKMGGGPKQFGVDVDQAERVLDSIRHLGLAFEGFHLFAGSQNLRADSIAEAQQKVAAEVSLPAGYSTTGAPLTVTVASTETATGSSDSVSSTITLIADYTTSTTGGANNNANTLSGSGGNNLIDGQGGDDNISGNAGNDYIIGGAGNDTLNGGTGNDVLLGGIGNDIILGGTGSDLIRGGAGNDTLTGGATAGAADDRCVSRETVGGLGWWPPGGSREPQGGGRQPPGGSRDPSGGKHLTRRGLG